MWIRWSIRYAQRSERFRGARQEAAMAAHVCVEPSVRLLAITLPSAPSGST